MTANIEKRRIVLTLVLLMATVAVTRIVFSMHITAPGIMEALYNYHVAENLYAGRGFVVDYVWNYLHRFTDITGHPSNAFQPPGVSLILLFFFKLLGPSVACAQFATGLFSAALVGITFYIGLVLLEDYYVALYASVFMIFNALVAYHSSSTDSTIPFAVMANLSLLPLCTARRGNIRHFLLSMAAASVCPYLRADGIILPVFVIGYYIWLNRLDKPDYKAIALLFALWLLPQLPWAVHSSFALGSFIPVHPLSTILICSSDQLFCYHNSISLAGSLSLGPACVLASKGKAFLYLLSALVFRESIILFVFSFVTFPWALRSRQLMPFFIYSLLLLCSLSVFFSYQAKQGAFLHSMVTLYPFFACLSVSGFRDLMMTLSTKSLRRGMPSLATQFRTARDAGIHAILLINLAVWAYKCHPATGDIPKTFQDLEKFYGAIEHCLELEGVPQNKPVLATDPFFTYHYCRRPAAIIPRDANPEAIIDVADRYGATHIIAIEFENNSPQWTEPYYRVGNVLLKDISNKDSILPEKQIQTKAAKVPNLNIKGFRIYEILPGGI